MTFAKQPLAAIEIKSKLMNVDSYALNEFKKEYPKVKTFIVCTFERPRMLENETMIMPWDKFLIETLPELIKGIRS